MSANRFRCRTVTTGSMRCSWPCRGRSGGCRGHGLKPRIRHLTRETNDDDTRNPTWRTPAQGTRATTDHWRTDSRAAESRGSPGAPGFPHPGDQSGATKWGEELARPACKSRHVTSWRSEVALPGAVEVENWEHHNGRTKRYSSRAQNEEIGARRYLSASNRADGTCTELKILVRGATCRRGGSATLMTSSKTSRTPATKRRTLARA
jgi:hypothetical protein